MGRKASRASPILLIVAVLAAPASVPAGDRVLLVSFDGLRADAVEPDLMPFLSGLRRSAVHTLRAQSLKPTYTIPNHVSMLTGLLPETHGCTMLADPGEKIVDGTIFEIAHDAGLSTALYISKNKLRLLAKPGTLDRYVVTNTGYCDDVVAAFLGDLASPDGRYDLTVVHLQDLDTLGHSYGWMSEKYLQGATRIDGFLQDIFRALESAGLLGGTAIFLVADHGGVNYEHGEDVPEVRDVPWMVLGPRTPRGKRILTPVRIHDTAPTILQVLGLPVPSRMEGRTVPEVFAENWPTLRRADVDADGSTNATDAIGILELLFRGLPAPCAAAADADGDLSVNLTDAVYLLHNLFRGGPEPPPPFLECGLPEAILPGFPCPAACR